MKPNKLLEALIEKQQLLSLDAGESERTAAFMHRVQAVVERAKPPPKPKIPEAPAEDVEYLMRELVLPTADEARVLIALGGGTRQGAIDVWMAAPLDKSFTADDLLLRNKED